jgi:RHS repeat-associated protein
MRKVLAYGAIHHKSRQSWLRFVAAALIPVHVLTLQPVMVWAAPKDAAPTIPEVIVPAIPSSPPPVAGPSPDLLAREEARLEKAKAALPFKFKPQTDEGEPRELPDTPSDIQITHCGIFKTPIFATGKSTPKENAALGAALQYFRNRDHREDISILEEWIKKNPASVWRTSVQLQVGEIYLENGYFNRAVTHLKPVYSLAKQAKGQSAEYLLGQAAVLYSKALARSGDSVSANEVLQEMDGKPQSGPVMEELRRMRAKVPRPDSIRLTGTCGLEAVAHLRRATFPNTELPLVLRSMKEQTRLNVSPASNVGLNLNQLEILAKAAAVPLIPGKKQKNAEWVAPSIIHWKSQHFSLLLKKSGNSYLIRDPYLGGDQWISAAALAEETTGFAMLGVPNLPKGWTAPSKGEMNAISGRQAPSPADPLETEECKECDEQAGGNSGSGGCGSCGGMPDYSLYLAQASLKIKDTPVSYQSPFGSIAFTATYHQRNIVQPIYQESDMLGPNWTFNWLSWVDDNVVYEPCPLWGWDDPEEGQLTKEYDRSIHGSATVYEIGGGTTTFNVNPYQLNWTIYYGWSGTIWWIDSYLGHCPFNSAVVFAKDNRSNSTLTRVGGPTSTQPTVIGYGMGYDCCEVIQTTALQYERRTVDGTIYHYGFDGTYGFSYGTRAYLAYIQYPSGRKLALAYSQGVPMQILRIDEITSAGTDTLMQFHYTLSGIKWLMDTVTDKAGRTAQLAYNVDGKLSKITDAEGMSSSFEYSNGDFISTMKTPYAGETVFAEGVLGDSGRWIQASRVIDGAVVRTERVELRPDSVGQPQFDPLGTPAGMNVRNGALDRRNSYYWDFRAMAEMGNPGPNDSIDYDIAFGLARQIHWTWDLGTNRLLAIPLSKKAPLEGRIWYEYGATNGAPDQYSEAQPFATAIGRILDGSISQVNHYEFNSAGRVKKTIDAWDPDRNPTTAGRTTESEYTPDGELLIKIKQKTGPSTYDTLAEFTYNPTQVSPPAVDSNLADDRLPATRKDAAGRTVSYTYDNDGRITSVKRTRASVGDEITSYVYYDGSQGVNANRLWKIVAPNTSVMREFTYDTSGRVLTIKNADNYVVTKFYDNLDRQTKLVYPDSTYEQTIYYLLDGEWLRSRDGRWTHSEHDPLRNVTALTDALGRKTQFDWCACGALDGITDAAGEVTTFVRDLQGRVTSQIYSDNKEIVYKYQPLSGRLAWVLDARNQRTNYEYYEDNSPKRISYSDQNGNALPFIRADVDQPVDWTYDNAYSRPISMNDGTGTTLYGYVQYAPTDTTYGDGRLQSVDGPLNNDTITYVYDEYGRVKQRDIDGAANSSVRSFDNLGRVEWEANSLVRDAANPDGKFNYTYAGNTGRLIEWNNGQGFRTVYDFYPNAGAAGTGDGDLRLSAIKHYSNTNTLDAQYDYHYAVGGQINRWTLRWGSGLTLGHDYNLSYDAAEQLLGAEDLVPGTPNMQQRFGYTYDAIGNRKVEQIITPDGGGGTIGSLTAASYNSLNQMTSRTGGSGVVEAEGTVNELSEVKIEVKVGSTVTQPAQPVTSFWQKSPGLYGFKGNVALTNGTNTITVTAKDGSNNQGTFSTATTASGAAIGVLNYDDAGNMINDGSRQYVWDAASRLVKIVHPGGSATTELTYDGIGRRVRIVEKSNGVAQSDKRFVWEGIMSVAEERDAFNTVTQRFFAQGEKAAGTVFLYRRDHLGSIREVVNATGVMQSRYDYDLWGRITLLAGVFQSDRGYTGHYFHAPSGLHLSLYRAYSAELGRWLSRDPIGIRGGINMYSYVLNSPVNKNDPLGLYALMVCCRCKDGGASMRCQIYEWTNFDHEPDLHNPDKVSAPFDTNVGPNSESDTPNDPYGHNGPIPPGRYDIRPRVSTGGDFPPGTPSITDPSNPTPGSITTPRGTSRNHLYIHGPGPSDGCITCKDPGGVKDVMDDHKNNGGLHLEVHEVECCKGKYPDYVP